MFGWRRRSEGFEWREYVRTTVLVRRADRQRKIDDARMEVLAKVKDTRDRGVEVGRASVEAASNRVASCARAIAQAVWRATKSGVFVAWRVTRSTFTAILAHVPAMPAIPRPEFGIPRALRGVDGRRLLPDIAWTLPFRFNWQMIGGAALVLLAIVVGGPMLQSSNDITTARFIPTVSVASVDKVSVSTTAMSDDALELSGRAIAISGDLLRINGRLVRLAGIEPPDAKHPCVKENGRRWNCSASARSALDKIVHGKAVACTPSGQDEQGRTLASCLVKDADVAGELVRGGHVFAASGLFASYASAEKEARAAKAGLWQGDTLRPQEWREQIWEEAKRAAPEGCPIKGFMRASDRVYAMPWAQAYDGAKVRAVKGDRWFCSEEEARAAGFKAASKS